MYKFLIATGIVVMASPAYAQKPDMTAGVMAAKNQKDYVLAKKHLDTSFGKLNDGGNLSPKDQAKLWHWRGVTYLKLYQTKVDENLENLDIALDSFRKDRALPESKLKEKSARYMLVVNKNYNDIAIEAFTAKEFKKSSTYFLKVADLVHEISGPAAKIDTASIENANIASSNAKDWNTVIEISDRLIGLEPTNANNHISKINALSNMDDDEALINAIKEGRKHVPSSDAIVNFEVNYYLERKENDKLLTSLKDAIAINPNLPVLHFAMGATYAELGNNEEAKAAYLKAIEIDPNNFDAYNNLSALYLDRTNALTEEMNNLGFSKADLAKSDRLKEERDGLYREIIPFMNKALEIDPKSGEIMEVLKQVYYQLGDVAKFKEIKERIDSLE